MDKLLQAQGTQVQRLIEVDPDKLIEIGHRLKAAAMDKAYPGESVMVPFTQGITLLYHPEREYVKPLHTTGSVSIPLGDAQTLQ
jgi:hypothetical protein